MLQLVNGQELEFAESNPSIERLSDRVLVKTPEGCFSALVVRSGDVTHVSYRGGQYRIEKVGRAKSQSSENLSGQIQAPMPGTIVQVHVQKGEQVLKGAPLIVLEAMKTQQILSAPFKGVIQTINILAGMQVSEGELLAILVSTADD